MKSTVNRLAKLLFFALVVRPVVLFVLGLNRRGLDHLPSNGPAVIVANHNSHLDTLVLMSLYPLSRLHRLRPVAARDYFFKNALLKWFALTCIGIIPLDRSGGSSLDVLFAPCHEALDRGEILILYPEGSRGQPEKMGRLRKGLFYLLRTRAQTPIIPVLMKGLGFALPRGEALLVPYCCDVIVGEAMHVGQNALDFNRRLKEVFDELGQYCLSQDVVDPQHAGHAEKESDEENQAPGP